MAPRSEPRLAFWAAAYLIALLRGEKPLDARNAADIALDDFDAAARDIADENPERPD